MYKRAWKEALHRFFEACLAFFFPQAHADIDWSRRHEMMEYQEKKRMPFIDIVERARMEKGLIEGIEVSLELKFGEEGLKLLPEIRQIQDHEALRKILRAIKTAASPDELRRVWARGRRPKKTRRN